MLGKSDYFLSFFFFFISIFFFCFSLGSALCSQTSTTTTKKTNTHRKGEGVAKIRKAAALVKLNCKNQMGFEYP